MIRLGVMVVGLMSASLVWAQEDCREWVAERPEVGSADSIWTECGRSQDGAWAWLADAQDGTGHTVWWWSRARRGSRLYWTEGYGQLRAVGVNRFGVLVTLSKGLAQAEVSVLGRGVESVRRGRMRVIAPHRLGETRVLQVRSFTLLEGDPSLVFRVTEHAGGVLEVEFPELKNTSTSRFSRHTLLPEVGERHPHRVLLLSGRGEQVE